MLSYNTYSKKRVKTIFPNNKISVDGEQPIPGIEYVCFGFPYDDGFIATSIKPLCQIKFSVRKILSQNESNGYCFLSVNILEYQHGEEIPHIKNVIVEGLFFNVYPDAEFEGLGYWKENFKGKETFVLTEHTEVLTSSTVSVFNYLKYVFKGHRISDKTLKNIIDIYDIKAIDAIKSMDIGLIRIVKKHSKLGDMQTILSTNFEQEQAFKYLIEYSIPSSVAIKVLEKYKKLAYIQIKKNPYCLLNFSDIDLATIDRMAKKQGLPYNNPDRMQACILYYIQNKTNQLGDIYVSKKEIIGPIPSKKAPLNKIIKKIGVYNEPILNSDIDTVLFNLEVAGDIVIEDDLLNPGNKCVYKSYYNKIENEIVWKLKNINTSITSHYVPLSDIENYLKSLDSKKITLDILQKQAVQMALQNRLSILTGGPGTGKTQTIKVIVDTLLSYNPSANIQLCAPTGKASRRMSEVIGRPAETIHKKLNYMPFESGTSNLEIIDCDLLIVDETSMLDIDLFYKLLKNVSDTTGILLVGDYNQLPSVGPGLILRDIIDSGVIPTIQLKKVFRQKDGADIVSVSHAILENKPDNVFAKKDSKAFKFKTVDSNSDIIKEILKYVAIAKDKQLNILEFQVLTPMNDGLLGTLGLNKKIQDILNPADASKDEIMVSPTKKFRTGDKVIQTVNNYDLHVFNGSIGIITEINEINKSLKVEYDGNVIEYKSDNINELNLAYAITVHKSQGSEFNFVIMPITSNHQSINNRNLVYTALTRAKKQFIFVGSELAFREAINVEETVNKKSQIKPKLML